MKKIFFLILALFSGYGVYLQTTSAARLAAGKKVYNQACLVCHMSDGNGVPGLNPPLAGTSWVIGDKKRLINVLLKGLNEPLDINDETYNNPMPAQAHLSDQEIADVLSYIRSSFGNKAGMVAPEEVKKLRAAKK